MKTFAFEVRSPEKIFFSGPVQQISLKAVDGEIAILPDHAPLSTILAPGKIHYRDESGETHSLEPLEGFLIVRKNQVSILVSRS